MAEIRTLARPYAEAVFELASQGGRLAEWGDALQALAAIAAHPDVSRLVGNPRVDDDQLADAIIGIAGDRLDDAGRNFVRLLSEKGRLTLLPAIAEQFAALRAEAENRVEVTVTAAAEISESQQQALTKALEQRLSRQVSLTAETDAELIGGAVIRAGDLVIDGSLRAQLARLEQSLAH
ncbi:F0F1 ATP synthase subunit delta [Salinisphaera sp. P385]|uniref:ATP synthase subunit delta n=1 Tax=Spectribacter acetivorans TaxID=3075603 RepID=A0ABU3B9T8_9GAMM|nr:F0F1 ATP synthase subunit delta [Salinisphaera sp. P385]MDT0619240.1 F0F1 ATP synthase subunit delta [Salinisphaera sp. P385]